MQVLALVQYFLLQSIFIIEASVRSGKVKTLMHGGNLKEHSSNQISVKEEEKAKSEDDQFYYLPMQTIFGEADTSAGSGGLSTTSPPHLSIDPAPIQTDYQKSTILQNGAYADGTYYSSSHQSQCVSETPVIDLESRVLLPSEDIIKESVVMSGHLEIASKTSSVEEVSEIVNMVSRPSIALQETILHSHSSSDL